MEETFEALFVKEIGKYLSETEKKLKETCASEKELLQYQYEFEFINKILNRLIAQISEKIHAKYNSYEFDEDILNKFDNFFKKVFK